MNIEKILADHKLWLAGEGGSRADLRGAILPNSTLLTPRYHVVWWNDQLVIGCQQFSINEWREFTDNQIKEMDLGALEWWRDWKDIIMAAIELSEKEAA
jgi:hypothetical protein